MWDYKQEPELGINGGRNMKRWIAVLLAVSLLTNTIPAYAAGRDSSAKEDGQGRETSEQLEEEKEEDAAAGDDRVSVVRAALDIVPRIYAVLDEAEEDGNFSKDEFKDRGVDYLYEEPRADVIAGITEVMVDACHRGVFGAALKNIDGELPGEVALLTLKAVHYGYKLAAGEITEEEYSAAISEEAYVSAAKHVSEAAFEKFLPFIPFSGYIGRAVGALLAIAGYRAGKKAAVTVQEAGGAGGILSDVKEDVKDKVEAGKDKVEAGKEKIADLDLKGKAKNLKDKALRHDK